MEVSVRRNDPEWIGVLRNASAAHGIAAADLLFMDDEACVAER